MTMVVKLRLHFRIVFIHFGHLFTYFHKNCGLYNHYRNRIYLEAAMILGVTNLGKYISRKPCKEVNYMQLFN